MITFKQKKYKLGVYLNGKHVGDIIEIVSIGEENCGFKFYPKGSKRGGELFKDIEKCKASLLDTN